MNNYKNRRLRGQCASCTKQAIENEVRCAECKELHRQSWIDSRTLVNAKRRKKASSERMARNRRLDEIDRQLRVDIAELEKIQ